MVYNETDSLDFISRDAIMEVRALATLFVDFRSDGCRTYSDFAREEHEHEGCDYYSTQGGCMVESEHVSEEYQSH